MNDLELLPQLININSKVLSKDAQELNIIYSSVVNHTININNANWL